MRTTTTALALSALMLAAAIPLAQADDSVPTLYGSHIVTYFRMFWGSLDTTTVLAVVDPAGALIMYAYVQEDELWATDGAGRAERVDIDGVGSSRHRLDVILHADTYTIHFDQKNERTLRTFTSASQGTWMPDPRSVHGAWPDEVEWAGQRADNSDMAYDEEFTSAISNWETVGIRDRVHISPDNLGARLHGFVEVWSGPEAVIDPLLNIGVAYLRAPTAGMQGSYHAEAAVTLRSNLIVPLSQVALAGVTGDPERPQVNWAVQIDRSPPEPGRPWAPTNSWALFFVDADGARTKVSPAWSTTLWQFVAALVDEPNDEIVILVDGVETGRFHSVGTSTHIAVGDIDPLFQLGGAAMYDALALYRPATPGETA